jgi:uncharacterized protein YndB with AHSA1/START domain
MVKVECSTTIKRSVEDVFAVLSNPANDVRWSSAALEAELTSPGPVGVGTTSRSVSKILGRRIESKWEVTEFEPNRRLAAQSHSGPFPVHATLTAEPIEGGTRVIETYHAEPAGFFKLAEPLMLRMGKRQLQSDLDNLKDLMEANAL